MRTVLWAALLLTLLGAVASSPHATEARPSAEVPARVSELELAVAWESGPPPSPTSNVWRAAFSIANLSGVATGPLRLQLRTPLGLLSESLLAPNLPAGGALHRAITVALAPGLSELCLDVRAVDSGRTLAEADLSNNRVCRRIPRRTRTAESSHAARLPEKVR